MKKVFLISTLILCFSAGCLGPISGLYPPVSGEPVESVYVLNHGWHTGLVLPTHTLKKDSLPPNIHFNNNPYLEIGWGDEGFYRAQKVTAVIAARAVLWPTPTVLHCVAVDRPVAQFFPVSGIIKVDLSKKGYNRMLDFLASSYRRDKNNKPIDLGPGIYGTSSFYRARGKYFFPNTCNKWTAKALRSAGCPITSFYAVRSKNVFNQTAKFGTVIRDFQKD